MNSEIINQLFIAARDLDTGGPARLVAAIYDRKKLISCGFNDYRKSHTFQCKYGCNVESRFWHAETRAVHNAVSMGIDICGMSLYVARARNVEGVWQYGMSRPCIGCMKCVKDYGLRKVVFSLNQSGFGVLENE